MNTCYLTLLVVGADSTHSIVRFQNINIEPDVSYFVTVQARDSTGVDITTGGDAFYLDVRNKCTWVDLNECTPDGTAEQAVSGVSRTLMDDNGDGTYTSKYLVTKEGQFTVSVFLYDHDEPVKMEYYDG